MTAVDAEASNVLLSIALPLYSLISNGFFDAGAYFSRPCTGVHHEGKGTGRRALWHAYARCTRAELDDARGCDAPAMRPNAHFDPLLCGMAAVLTRASDRRRHPSLIWQPGRD